MLQQSVVAIASSDVMAQVYVVRCNVNSMFTMYDNGRWVCENWQLLRFSALFYGTEISDVKQ